MTTDQFIDLMARVLFVLPLVGIACTAFLWHVYRTDTQRPRSWVLFNLAIGSSMATAISLLIGGLAFVRLTGTSLGQVGGILLVLAVFFLELIPMWFAFSVWRVRTGLKGPFSSFRDRH